jgi:hypothetical protein
VSTVEPKPGDSLSPVRRASQLSQVYVAPPSGSWRSRRVRNEQLSDDALVVVRGGELHANAICTDAIAAYARFGEYGISVFSAADEAALDALARDRRAQFDIRVLMTGGRDSPSRLGATADVPPTALHDHAPRA